MLTVIESFRVFFQYFIITGNHNISPARANYKYSHHSTNNISFFTTYFPSCRFIWPTLIFFFILYIVKNSEVCFTSGHESRIKNINMKSLICSLCNIFCCGIFFIFPPMMDYPVQCLLFFFSQKCFFLQKYIYNSIASTFARC